MTAPRWPRRLDLVAAFGGLALCMAAGALAPTAAIEVAVIAVFSVVLLFIWPALEALILKGLAGDTVNALACGLVAAAINKGPARA